MLLSSRSRDQGASPTTYMLGTLRTAMMEVHRALLAMLARQAAQACRSKVGLAGNRLLEQESFTDLDKDRSVSRYLRHKLGIGKSRVSGHVSSAQALAFFARPVHPYNSMILVCEQT